MRTKCRQTLAERVRPLRPVSLGDDLFCSQPTAQAMLATGAGFLFVCKKDSHKTLYEFLQGIALEHRTVLERKPGNHSVTYTFPLDGGSRCATARTRFRSIGSGSRSPAPRQNHLQRSFRDQPAGYPEECGRDRNLRPSPLKIENQSFNVLKTTDTTRTQLRSWQDT